MSRKIPDTFPDGFSNIREIGNGGEGVVWSGMHKSYGQSILKQVRNKPSNYRERDAMQALVDTYGKKKANNDELPIDPNSEPKHVCHPYGSYVEDIDLYLIMEPMEYVFTDFRASTPFALISIACESMKGILELRRSGVISDDIKPENMGLRKGKVAHFDLGCGRFFNKDNTVGGHTSGYAAPEIVQGIPSNTSDVYSWARSIEQFAFGDIGLGPYYLLSDQDQTAWIGRKFSEMVAQCCAENPNNRPNFEELYKRLKYLRDEHEHIRCPRCSNRPIKFKDAPCVQCNN